MKPSIQPLLRLGLPLSVLLAIVGIAGCVGDDGDDLPEEPRETPMHAMLNAGASRMPPVAEKMPHPVEAHGEVRIDDYYWMRDRDDERVISYLEAENEYTEAVLAPTAGLRERLVGEMRGRIPEVDATVPVRIGDDWYYTRHVEGGEYEIYCRRRGAEEAPEEVLLDGNAMASGHDYFAVTGFEPSPNGRYTAFAVDTLGRRLYTIRVRDSETGELLVDEIPGTDGNSAWAADNRTFFYTKRDPDTLRAYQVYRHVLGSDPADDEVVFEETDDTYETWVGKSRSGRFLLITSLHTLASEVRFLAADDPDGEWTVFLERERGHEYSIDHAGNHFWIRTNRDAGNFRVAKTPIDDRAPSSWSEVVPHDPDVLVEAVVAFRAHIVVAERREGLPVLVVHPGAGEAYDVEVDESAYTLWVGRNPEVDTSILRYVYSSMTTPRSVFDLDMETGEAVLRKRTEIPGGFDRSRYRTERLWATARDGARVPVSLVHRADLEPDGSNPLLLYGYGAYGSSLDAGWSANRLSLLDRGLVYAIAHVRGGQEMGRDWYESGKLLEKKNSFNDFVDSARFLVEEGWADASRVYAEGASAGGLLMGAVVNQAPELFHGVVAEVPFVDAVTTMLDPTIPLTSFEWDEWGDPREREAYDYLLSYSPYDRLEAKDYPHLLVTSGLHDSQVQYWEPTKWVAKLRAMKTDDNLLLLKTDMESGHGGASGRFEPLRDLAVIYAFYLDLAGLSEG